MVPSWAPPAQNIVLSRREASNAASIRGIGLELLEAQIAAITKAHGAVLAARNSAGIAECGVRVVDPWQSSGRLSLTLGNGSPLSISTTRLPPTRVWEEYPC